MCTLKKFMKKTLAVMLAAVLPASFAAAFQIGDVIGEVLLTDIRTYIDGEPIKSYNIAGRTAVIAQDLADYGFSVSFDEALRTLTVSRSGEASEKNGEIAAEEVKPEDVGKRYMDVLYTDIKTIADGTELESFNVDGMTAVYTDDLAKLCGSYEWLEAERRVNITLDPLTDSGAAAVKAKRELGADISEMTRTVSSLRWGEAAKSHLIPNADGTFLTVEIADNINIEKYDAAFNHISSFAIPKELEIFGGMLCGKDYNYIAFGQPNYSEDNAREVIKIVIYDKSFVKISEVSISNCKTALPFDASIGDMCEDDRYLVLHTSRSQYKEENGERPQTQLTVIIDKQTWQVVNMLGKFQYNHTSHALRECARIDSDRIVTVDLSDAAPMRAVILRTLDFSGNVFGTQSLFNISGALAANCTGVSLGGMEVSDKGYLTAISSIDQSVPTGFNSLEIEGLDRDDRDIYLLFAERETWEQRHRVLAKYTGTDASGSTPYLVKLDNGSFMVLWAEFRGDSDRSAGIRYAITNGLGEALTTSDLIRSASAVPARLSASCKPVFADGKVIWYVNTEEGRTFFSVRADADFSPENGSAPDETPAPQPDENKADDKGNNSNENTNESTEVDGI